MKKLILILAAFLLLHASPVRAAPCSPYPYTLTNGQLADANQVMADYNLVRNCVLNNAASIGANFDIISINGLTTPLPISEGGTGSTTGSGITAGALSPGGTIAITGDLAYTSPIFTGSNVTAAGTLATVNGSPGTYANATVVVNAKGLVTSATSTAAATTSVAGPVTLASNATALTGTDTAQPIVSSSLKYVLTSVSGPGPLAKAWVSFDSSGNIEAGYNVSSVTKNGTGDFTVNFTTSMVDQYFAVAVTPMVDGGPNSFSFGVKARAVGSVEVQTYSSTTGDANTADHTSVIVFR